MKPTPPLNLPAQLSIGALAVLGLVGSTLVVAHSGFETSPRRGGPSTFVPLPEAYLIAGVMYLMSCLAMLALLRDRKVSLRFIVIAFCVHLAAAVLLVRVMAPL